MELALSLGDTSKPFTTFIDKPKKMVSSRDLGFCMGLGKSSTAEEVSDHHHSKSGRDEGDSERRGSSDPPVHELDLLPFSPVPRSQTSSSQLSFSWLTQHLSVAGEPGSSNGIKRSIGVEKKASEEGTSSPNSAASSFQMDFSIYRNGFSRSSNKLSELEENDEGEMMDRGVSSKVASDEDDQNIGSMARKKLRLTKQQSAFLEESFKEHNTLNPKQKLALAKQLNLRPRQVEVWFQNRRARTKLKQTEIDCEYLKRCCETLTEENRRLQKELQELRALKSSQPFYMQLPPTTLTMCPSCERIANNNTSTASENVANTTLSLAKPRQTPPTLMVPFSPSQQVQAPQAAAASS